MDETVLQEKTLQDRRDEILPLAKHFIKVADEQIKTGHKEFSKEAEEYLLAREWDGNGKELENAVKKACILSGSPILHIEDFDFKQKQVKSIGGFIEEKLSWFMRNITRLEKFNLYDTVLTEVEKVLILMVMKETGGNQLRASKLLGINRNTLREKIKKLKINVKS